MTECYIYDHVRTPRGRGRPDGALHEVQPIELASGMLRAIRDRSGLDQDPDDDLVGTGGSGFGVMALIVAAECGWITRGETLDRLSLMLGFLERSPCFHGLFPHYIDGRTGAPIRF